eukprot:TRINITY_DN41136_c0_g1_i1.p1 TRINITY_DN41136_c0_g1~~TRINITY_DN41136_c0_g1_i1.p1  ORF type:complete len:293 (-),score=34.87 TRINITY_DN41136_c0_g1_i1:481-1275(-)
MDWLVRVAEDPQYGDSADDQSLLPWFDVAASLSRALLRRGWSECFLAAGKGGAAAGDPFSRRVLICNILKPFFHTASFSPLRIDKDAGIAYSARSCPHHWIPSSSKIDASIQKKLESAAFLRSDMDGCWYDQAEDWAGRWRGRVPVALVYPLGRCSGYGRPVPCPNDSIKFLQGSEEHRPRCLVAPVITGDRNPYDGRNVALLEDGLLPQDVDFLRHMAAHLADQGFSSFNGSFGECRYKDWRDLHGNLEKWQQVFETPEVKME